jgi:hypothetical protein
MKKYTPKDKLDSGMKEFFLVETNSLNISSSEIRKRLQNGISVDEFYPDLLPIVNYMNDHYLWCDPPAKTILVEDSFRMQDWDNSSLEEVLKTAKLCDERYGILLRQCNGYSCKLVSFKIARIGLGKGFRSLVFRFFDINYENGNGLSSLVVKFPHVASVEWNLFMIEKSFFEQLAPKISTIR